ncbi:MAG: hypothetical protein R2697_21705 [Ilumatobacteraceae bacterium]
MSAACQLAPVEQLGGVLQRARHPRQIGGGVHVATELVGQIERCSIPASRRRAPRRTRNGLQSAPGRAALDPS